MALLGAFERARLLSMAFLQVPKEFHGHLAGERSKFGFGPSKFGRAERHRAPKDIRTKDKSSKGGPAWSSPVPGPKKTFPWNSRTKTRHEVGNKAPTCPAWLSVRQKLRTRDSMAKPRDSKSLHARPVPHGEYHRSLSSSTFEMFQWSKVVS